MNIYQINIIFLKNQNVCEFFRPKTVIKCVYRYSADWKYQHPKTGSLIRSYTQLTVIMVYFYLRLKSKATLSSLYWCVSEKKSTGNSLAAFICDQKSINLNHNWLTEKNLYLYNTNYIVTKWLIILKIIFYVCKCYASACAVCTKPTKSKWSQQVKSFSFWRQWHFYFSYEY